jgi:8-oxo-dGTP pyrophosphatase MutT (NUDIX family)
MILGSMLLSDLDLETLLDPATEHWRSRKGLRDAAVIALLFRKGPRDHLLLTKRHSDLPTHAGEVAFPGGAREGDETPLECALRECREEIGLAERHVAVLGSLPARVSIAGFLVSCFVGRFDGDVELEIDESEVDCLLDAPIEDLADEQRWEWRILQAPPYRRVIPFFPIGEDMLWGLTGVFTVELLRRLGLHGE